ncbi:MAG: chromate resistance protein ChrB domain-containing protein [Hyphomicrobiaceae bacterium]
MRQPETLVRADDTLRWLLLIHQLPAKPAYVRVKVWRRLHALGAIAVKNAVHALPASEQSQEDFEWLLKEIIDSGGEAIICGARLIGGLSDTDVCELFKAARDADYADIATEARALSARFAETPATESHADLRAQLSRLKNRYAQTVGVDFFDANGRQAADGLIRGLEEALVEQAVAPEASERPPEPGVERLKRRVWVTRIGVHVDRIGCAWLVRRFIDSHASFKFVPPKGYVPESNELRFDMFDAEFTHEGDRCSFEVLMSRAGLDDPALTAIAEIVHDIDLKDEKFGREEAPGIKTLINGICAGTRDDDERLVRGAAIFDDLYAVFSRKRGSKTDRKTEG